MAGKATAEDIFVWEGADKKGAKIKGETNGRSIALVKADLRRQGINPTKVRKKPKPLLGIGGKKGKKITTGDIAVFSRQLATMMTAGVPLVQAFEIAGRGHENPNIQDLLLAIKNELESGTTLAESSFDNSNRSPINEPSRIVCLRAMERNLARSSGGISSPLMMSVSM